MLKYLDTLGIYDRSIAHPFLLFDGHHSRMMLPFLKYVNRPEHKWVCCFGVPYATHIWQVADASSLNGAFKIEPAKAKRNYIEHRDVPKFESTDIVLLVNRAFPNSFGKYCRERVESSQLGLRTGLKCHQSIQSSPDW
jgi:hypothetical protein